VVTTGPADEGPFDNNGLFFWINATQIPGARTAPGKLPKCPGMVPPTPIG
jgi:hypothetical protein